MEKVTTLGIDLAKNVFQLHGIDEQGRVVLNKKLSRIKLKGFIANLPVCLIGMEACGSANYWARQFQRYGHTVKLMSPQFVKPYVKSNKNDDKDAQAIAEAVRRPTMNFVPIKQVAHQDIQCVHRIRERLVHNRTALSNQTRGLLSEYGIVIAEGIGKLRKELPFILEDATNELTDSSRELFFELLQELKVLDKRIEQYNKKIQRIFDQDETCQRIGEVEGVGPITATAMVATVSDPREFKNGRQLSAWLGLVPRQNSSGGKTVLLGISKRGNQYVRTLLIHGARSVLKRCSNKKDRRSLWLMQKERTRGFNRACVALANKNARVIWALMAHKTEYRKAA